MCPPTAHMYQAYCVYKIQNNRIFFLAKKTNIRSTVQEKIIIIKNKIKLYNFYSLIFWWVFLGGLNIDVPIQL